VTEEVQKNICEQWPEELVKT